MIKRYECFTGHKHHEATVTDDGPWVSHDDHAKEIDTLRDQITRRDEEIRDLRHEIESARDAAKGENALRLEAEDDHAEEIATLRADVERWVKEVAHLKLAMEKSERKRERDTSVSAKDRFYGYARRSWASDDEAQSEERDDD